MTKRIRGAGRVFQRGGRYWVAYYVSGVEHRESAGDTAREAQSVLTERLAAVGRGEPVSSASGRLTVRELLDAHLDALEEKRGRHLPDARSHASRVLDGLGDVRVAKLTPTLIRRYTADQRADDLQDSTIGYHLRLLTAALNRARKEGRLAYVPFIPKPADGKPRQGFVEPETFTEIHAHLSDPYDDALEFTYMTGWRSGEVKGLVWEWVFRREGEIRLPETKNGDRRTIPLVGGLAELVERRHAKRDLSCPYVFHDKGQPMTWKLLTRFKQACFAAGVSGLIVHDLRRSGVRNLVRAGVREDVAMTISGHRSRDVFRRYDITSGDDQRAAFTALERYRAGRVGR